MTIDTILGTVPILQSNGLASVARASRPALRWTAMAAVLASVAACGTTSEYVADVCAGRGLDPGSATYQQCVEQQTAYWEETHELGRNS